MFSSSVLSLNDAADGQSPGTILDSNLNGTHLFLGRAVVVISTPLLESFIQRKELERICLRENRPGRAPQASGPAEWDSQERLAHHRFRASTTCHHLCALPPCGRPASPLGTKTHVSIRCELSLENSRLQGSLCSTAAPSPFPVLLRFPWQQPQRTVMQNQVNVPEWKNKSF